MATFLFLVWTAKVCWVFAYYMFQIWHRRFANSLHEFSILRFRIPKWFSTVLRTSHSTKRGRPAQSYHVSWQQKRLGGTFSWLLLLDVHSMTFPPWTCAYARTRSQAGALWRRRKGRTWQENGKPSILKPVLKLATISICCSRSSYGPYRLLKCFVFSSIVVIVLLLFWRRCCSMWSDRQVRTLRERDPEPSADLGSEEGVLPDRQPCCTIL